MPFVGCSGSFSNGWGQDGHLLEGYVPGMTLIMGIVAVLGVVHLAEIDYLRSVGDIFGLDNQAFERVTEITEKANQSDPHKVLGVTPGISDDDLKTTYRTLVRENHPDKLIAEGMPEELVELANEKLAAINDAYDRVIASRGIN